MWEHSSNKNGMKDRKGIRESVKGVQREKLGKSPERTEEKERKKRWGGSNLLVGNLKQKATNKGKGGSTLHPVHQSTHQKIDSNSIM